MARQKHFNQFGFATRLASLKLLFLRGTKSIPKACLEYCCFSRYRSDIASAVNNNFTFSLSSQMVKLPSQNLTICGEMLAPSCASRCLRASTGLKDRLRYINF